MKVIAEPPQVAAARARVEQAQVQLSTLDEQHRDVVEQCDELRREFDQAAQLRRSLDAAASRLPFLGLGTCVAGAIGFAWGLSAGLPLVAGLGGVVALAGFAVACRGLRALQRMGQAADRAEASARGFRLKDAARQAVEKLRQQQRNLLDACREEYAALAQPLRLAATAGGGQVEQRGERLVIGGISLPARRRS